MKPLKLQSYKVNSTIYKILDGEHQGCIMLPDGAFDVNSYHQVKTEILSFIEQRIQKKEEPMPVNQTEGEENGQY